MARKQSEQDNRRSGDGRRGKRAATRSAKPRRRSLALRGLYWMAVLFIWGGILSVGLGVYVVLSVQAPNLYQLPQRERGIVVLANGGEVLAHRGVFQGDAVRIDQLPSYVPQAVIAIEDRRYYSHFGVDPIGLARAMWVNLREGRIVQGGSTLSQQLAKNLFLEPERTLKRKMQELVLALWLEYQYSKDEILQLYLNRVYFGGGAYGIEAAAQRFFDKPAAELNLPEAAMLAGVLKAPSRYAPSADRELAEERAFLVLDSMLQEEFITAEEGQLAVDNPAALTRTPYASSRHYVVDWISELVPSFVAATEENLIVYTTIDSEIQDRAEAVVREHLDAAADGGATQAALVLMTPAGEIRALIGGTSYAESQFNRAVQARRQPGSAFKPFVYLTALENGLTPDSVRVDQPISVNGWEPRNYADRYYGAVTLRDALAYSLNTVAAGLTAEFGAGEVVERARRLGIRTELHTNPSIALGTAEVGLLEMAGAYASFANGGTGVLPHVITRITTLTGEVIYERGGSGLDQVVSPRNVQAMNEMLSGVMEVGTGRRAALDDHPSAGKTGTTQDFRDAWFIGYTAAFVAAVWTGNDDGSPMQEVTGGSVPAGIWHDLMNSAHRGMAPAALPGGEYRDEPTSIVDLLRDLSVATIEDLLNRNTDVGEQDPQSGGGGSFVDEITDNPR